VSLGERIDDALERPARVGDAIGYVTILVDGLLRPIIDLQQSL